MGVPITFLGRYNPKEFTVVGQGQGNLYKLLNSPGLSKNLWKITIKVVKQAVLKKIIPC